MISLLVLVIGMVGLMKVASVSVFANQRGQRLDQASTRAQTRLEALRNTPTATLECLAQGSDPTACEGMCLAAGGEPQSCKVALGLNPEAAEDSTGTQYSYGYLVKKPNDDVYDILVVTSYQDDNYRPPRTVRAFFRTAVYRPF